MFQIRMEVEGVMQATIDGFKDSAEACSFTSSIYRIAYALRAGVPMSAKRLADALELSLKEANKEDA